MSEQGLTPEFAQGYCAMTLDGILREAEITKKVIAAVPDAKSDYKPDPAALAAALEERDRRLLFEILFEPVPEPTWDDATNCLNVLRSLRVEEEMADLQRKIEAKPSSDELRTLLTRRLELQKLLANN